MRSLHKCLLDAHLVRLHVIARFWDVELVAKRQREVATKLAEAMAAPAAIIDMWNSLSDDQRQALGTLLANGGRMPLRVFARQWGEIRAMGPGRIEREKPWLDPVSPAEALWYKGLISRAFDQEGEETYEFAFIPPELQVHLHAPSFPPSGVALGPISPPIAARSMGETLLDDACTLLAYLQNKQVRPGVDGSWPARHEDHLAQRLRDPDPARLTFLHHLTQSLGWLRVTDSLLLRPDPGPVTTWLQSSENQQRSALIEAWRDDPTWNDLFHVPSLRADDTGGWRNDPLLARTAILRHLKVCTPGDWYKITGFVAAVKRADPDFQRPGGDYTTWYIREATSGEYLPGFENWDKVEGALIRYLITGPLAWLGLMDLGAPAPDEPPIAFQLTASGAAAIESGQPPSEPETMPLILRPDFTVRVPPSRRYERFQLARVADWVITDEHFVYRLTPSSLGRARQQGIPVTRVIQFLTEASGIAIPRSVETALMRWEARGTEAWLEPALVLRLSSKELLEQLSSSPRTHHLIREQIGPTVALVHEHDWPRLVVALGEMGMLADVTALEE
jgi:hypothetical protein